MLWTPDSERIVFSSNRSGDSGLYVRSVGTRGAAERLFTHPENLVNPASISPDGRTMIYREITPSRDNDLFTFDFESGETRALLNEPYDELNGEISPDGLWLAYQSDWSGRYEIYVRPFPNVDDDVWQVVSPGGGVQPVWHPHGDQLFFLSLEGELMRVSFESGDVPGIGNTEFVVNLPISSSIPNVVSGRVYDISPDGTRFLTVLPTTGSEATALYDVLLNFEELIRPEGG